MFLLIFYKQATIFLSENRGGGSRDLCLCSLLYLYAVGAISIVLCTTNSWKPAGPGHGTVAASTGDHTFPNFALTHVFWLDAKLKVPCHFMLYFISSNVPVSRTYLGDVRTVAVSRAIKYEYYRQYLQDDTSISDVSLKWHESRNEYVK